MVKSIITYKEEDFLREIGIETLGFYGNPGKINFVFYMFPNRNGTIRHYISRKSLPGSNTNEALENFKKTFKR